MDDDRPYEVGYGKPPRHTQFRKGTSGFAGHRHKSQATMSDQLNRILREKVSVTDGGKKQRLTKEEVFLRQFVSRAISGDRQCSKLMLEYLAHRQDQPDAERSNATDEFLVSELVSLLKSGSGGSDGG